MEKRKYTMSFVVGIPVTHMRAMIEILAYQKQEKIEMRKTDVRIKHIGGDEVREMDFEECTYQEMIEQRSKDSNYRGPSGIQSKYCTQCKQQCYPTKYRYKIDDEDTRKMAKSGVCRECLDGFVRELRKKPSQHTTS